MRTPETILLLTYELRQSREVLDRLEERFDTYLAQRVDSCEPGFEQSLAVTQMLTNYYTALETIFLRISQFFENALPSHQWHQALLDKMTLAVEPLRPAVLSPETRLELLELLRFRHFSRYFFELENDWDKLHLLILKYRKAKPLLQRDLAAFLGYLDRLKTSSRKA
jgi:hypothetical protein